MMDQRMMQNVRQATKDADAVLAIVDGNDRAEEALPLLAPYCRKGSVPLAVVLNKVLTLAFGNIAKHFLLAHMPLLNESSLSQSRACQWTAAGRFAHRPETTAARRVL